MTGADVQAIVGFERTVADLDRTEAFYRDGLGFVRAGAPEPVPAATLAAMGLPGARAMRLRMRLGRQAITFVAFDPPGAPYPDRPLSTDPFFQHVAMPVRDMARAAAGLAAVSPGTITEGGPQLLPASSGGVTALKLRDPDGHPLELLFFPDGEPAATWRSAPGLVLGIDHSAITVTDLDAALAFYGGCLGLALAHRGLNRGPAQAQLDGMPDPVVDVVALAPPAPTPHMELLHYRRPATLRPTPAPFGPRDRATTRFVFAVEAVADAARAIRAAGYPATASDDGAVAYAEGPDGHGLLLVPAKQ